MLCYDSVMANREDEVAAAIETALRVVEEAKVPEDLRTLAFEKAFDALTTTSAVEPAVRREALPAMSSVAAIAAEAAQRAASRLRVEPELIERVLDFDDDGVYITVPRSRFAAQKSVAIQQVAILIAGARQASGLATRLWSAASGPRPTTSATA